MRAAMSVILHRVDDGAFYPTVRPELSKTPAPAMRQFASSRAARPARGRPLDEPRAPRLGHNQMTADDFPRHRAQHERCDRRVPHGPPRLPRERPDLRHAAPAATARAWSSSRRKSSVQFMREHPTMFEPSSGAWGRQGCTDVRLAAADRATVRGAMVLAWEAVVAKAPARKPAAKKRRRQRPRDDGRRAHPADRR